MATEQISHKVHDLLFFDAILIKQAGRTLSAFSASCGDAALLTKYQ
jgi:hypothetical protein